MSAKPYSFDNFWTEYGSGVMAAYPAHEAQNIRDLCRLSWMTCIAMAPELPEGPTTAPIGVDAREAVALALAKMGIPRAPLTLADVLDWYRGEADKILSLIHPAPLVWTKEKPKVDGWYWLRLPGMAAQVERTMFDHEAKTAKWYSDPSDEWEPVLDGREWAGPIPQPGPNTPEGEG